MEGEGEGLDLGRRLTSRQFLVTVLALILMYRATMAGADVGPFATVASIAIGGHAGLNIMERKK